MARREQIVTDIKKTLMEYYYTISDCIEFSICSSLIYVGKWFVDYLQSFMDKILLSFEKDEGTITCEIRILASRQNTSI